MKIALKLCLLLACVAKAAFYVEQSKYLSEPMLCLLTVFVHSKLAPINGRLLQSDDDELFKSVAELQFSHLSLLDFESFLNSRRYVHILHRILQGATVTQALKEVFCPQEFSMVGAAHFVRKCVTEFLHDEIVDSAVKWIGTQYCILELPAEIAQIAGKMSLKVFALIPLKNMIRNEALELVPGIRYQIISLDDVTFEDIGNLENHLAYEGSYRIIDFASADLLNPIFAALIENLGGNGTSGLLVHWNSENQYICDRILTVLADEIQMISVSWDSIDFIPKMKNILDLKKNSLIALYDETEMKKNFSYCYGAYGKSILEALIPAHEASRLNIFRIENLLLEASSTEHMYLCSNSSEELTSNEKSLIFSLLMPRIQRQFGIPSIVKKDYGDYYLKIIDFYHEIIKTLLSLEHYDLCMKISRNFNDLLCKVFDIKESYMTYSEFFNVIADTISKAVLVIDEATTTSLPPSHICEFDRIVATFHHLNNIKNYHENYINLISPYFLLPSIYELDLDADWLHMSNIKLKTDCLIIFCHPLFIDISTASSAISVLPSKLAPPSKIFLHSVCQVSENIIKFLKNIEFPSLTGFLGEIFYKRALEYFREASNLSAPLKVIELSFSEEPIESVDELLSFVMTLNHIKFGSFTFLKILYDFVVDNDAQLGIRCCVKIKNILDLAESISDRKYSAELILSEAPFDHRFLRIYSILTPDLLIIDLGAARQYTKAKRAVQ